jgi:DNA-binding FrmR family transcriptional regulator
VRIQSSAVKDDLGKRLRRIEGQARGIQNMLYDDRDCHEIMQQFKAIQAAVRNASAVYMRSYAKECLLQADDHTSREGLIDEIMDLLS